MLSAQTSPQPKRHLDRFSGLCTDDRGVSLYFTMAWLFSLKIVPSHVGIWTSFKTWFIWPTRVCNANGNLIASAIFAGLTDWKSDRKTDRPRYSVQCAAKQLTKCTNKPYAIVNTASKEYIIATTRTWLVCMIPDSAVFSCFYPTKRQL